MFPGLTPHSTRTTFVSFLTEKDVPQIIIKKIVGHTSGDVTADVYTKLSLAPLLEAVNKL
jgi:integrase